TGVQTCALPICLVEGASRAPMLDGRAIPDELEQLGELAEVLEEDERRRRLGAFENVASVFELLDLRDGRACRLRVGIELDAFGLREMLDVRLPRELGDEEAPRIPDGF